MQPKTPSWNVITAVAIGAFIFMAAPIIITGHGPEGWLLSARWTARYAFHTFVIPFALLPIAGITADGPVRSWITAFAIAHGIHLAALTINLSIGPDYLDPFRAIIGGAIYAIVALISAAAIITPNTTRCASTLPRAVFR